MIVNILSYSQFKFKMNEPRSVKINLQIKQKRKLTLQSPIFKPNNEGAKTCNHHKKLQVTINNKRSIQNPSLIKNPEISQIKISEFMISQSQSHWHIFPKPISPKHKKQIIEKQFQRINFEKQQQRKQQEMEEQENVYLKQQICKKQSQIIFYQNLMNQNKKKHKTEQAERSQNWEQFLQKVIVNYQHEVDKGEQLSRYLKQIKQNYEFRLMRRQINLEGKMGLNYSPSQINTLDGLQNNLLLSNQISQENSQMKGANFSFGSHSKNKHSISTQKFKESTIKQKLNSKLFDFTNGRKIVF